MRLSLPAIALTVCIGPLGPAFGGPSGDPPKTIPAKSVPSTAAPSAPAPDAAASDAAARHAKRTACLKQARTKKLVGAERNSFIKDCIAAR